MKPKWIDYLDHNQIKDLFTLQDEQAVVWITPGHEEDHNVHFRRNKHHDTPGCWCKPRLIYADELSNVVWLHNSRH